MGSAKYKSMLPDDAQLENKTILKFEATACLSKRMTEPFERTKTPKLNESYFSNIFPVTASTLESYDCNFSFFTGSYLFETLSERLKRCSNSKLHISCFDSS